MAKRMSYHYHWAFEKSNVTSLMKENRKRPNPFQFPISKGCKRVALEDKITTLPDEILLNILSLLTVKEAVATSILSRRWRYVWTSLPRLHFRYQDVVQNDDKDNEILRHTRKAHGVYKDRCIQMVNQVLRARKARELREFGIHYPLLESSTCHIDLWVAFAIAIGVSKLELNFSPYPFPDYICLDKNYSIPLDLFDKTKGVESFLLQLDHVFSIPTSSLNVQNRFESLRELVLKFVDLRNEHFEAILSNCTSLECLHLLRCRSLVNVKHIVPHMKLNCLEIYHCSNLKNVEIFAPNLVSFKYRGPSIYIFVKDAKQLVNLCMCSYRERENGYARVNYYGLHYMQKKDFLFGQFADYLSRLEYLMMDVGSFEVKQGFNKVSLFSNLKHLSLTCLNRSHGPDGMLCCYHTVAGFVNASPFLHRLELHFSLAPTKNPELSRISISPHIHLKEVLVSGFSGNELARDIILSIFDFAIELEKIGITTVYLGDLSRRPYKNRNADIEVVRRCIQQLHQRLPANAQLHFLDDHF